MSSISNAVSHFPDVQSLFQSPFFPSRTNLLQARSQSLSNTHFTFVTSEGDRVSLSTASAINTSYETYSHQGLAEGRTASFHGQQFNASVQKSFQFLVEGDLNEQEQADIQEFLESAHNIFQELVDGNADKATNALATLDSLETLSQAALFIRQSTTVSVTTQSVNKDVQDTSGLAHRLAERPFPGPEQDGLLEHILNRLRETREKLQLDPEQLIDRLPSFSTTLLQSLRGDIESTDSDSSASILEQIKKRLFESLIDPLKNANPQQETDKSSVDKTANSTPVSPNADEATPPSSQLDVPPISSPLTKTESLTKV